MPEASANREDAHRTATGLPEAHGVERPQIIGSTRLIYGDQFMSQLWILPRKTPKAMIGFLISALVGAAVGALIAFGPNGVLELSREDWERIGQITLWIFVMGNLVWPLLGVLIGALQWRRLRQGHRRVSYEIDNKAITTRDAEGVSFTLPWSSVKRVWRTDKLLLIETVIKTWHYIPWRAINLVDQDRLWNEARAQAARNATALK
jgi:hypothetical protein